MKVIKILGAVLLASICSLSADDWPHWRGPNYNGISNEKSWSAEWGGAPKQLWKANVGIGFSSMSVADGRVYTMGHANKQDTVFCFDAETGKQIWKHSYPHELDPKYYEGGPSSTPTVDGKLVYALSKRGDVFCFQADNGKVVWNKNIAKEIKADMPTWGYASSPFVYGNLLILNVGTYGTALDKKTGKLVWSTGNDAAGYSTPVPAKFLNQETLVLFAAKEVVAINPKDGKTVWKFPWETSYDVNAADPIISGNRVFISSAYNRGCALIEVNNLNPRKVWENKEMRNHFNSCVLIDGHLYGVDGDSGPKANLKCIEFATGKQKWEFRGLGSGALMAADGKLIVLSDKGELLTANASPQAFNPISRAQVLGGKCWTAPVLANGRIYCRNAKGDLVCVDVRNKSIASR